MIGILEEEEEGGKKKSKPYVVRLCKVKGPQSVFLLLDPLHKSLVNMFI